MTTTASDIRAKGKAARQAARSLARLSSEVRNRALEGVARDLLEREPDVLEANRQDIEAGRQAGLSEAVLDRLLLTRERLAAIAADVRQVALLPDPLGEMFDTRTLPNGLQIGRKRVPLGVMAAVFESRPNVTVDIASLCLKSGNACILRGGKEAIHSNIVLAGVVREAITAAGVPRDAVQMIEDTDRALLAELLKMRDAIDLLVPRGGAELIRYVRENAAMPVLIGGTGVCHTYVDRAADIDKAVRVAHNAKTRKFSICNALDTLLVHQGIADEFLPAMARSWTERGVEMRCDERALRILKAQEIPEIKLTPASPDDFGQEFLAAAHLLALERLESCGGVYNLGGGTGFSNREVIETASKVTGKTIAVREEARRPGDPARLLASNERARQELGWLPAVTTLEAIIDSAWSWHQAHPKGYPS